MAAPLTFHHLTHTWPDGTTVLRDVDLTLAPGLHGLVGSNGSGKTTFLRLAAGELTPHHGTVVAPGRVERLPQAPWRHTGTGSVADALGVADRIAALRAVENGGLDPAHFAVLDAGGGAGWDVESRTEAWLAHRGLDHLRLDRHLADLSGGELSLLRVAAALLREPEVLLLDEPTNNLDATARGHLMRSLASFTGVVVAASHDRELLEQVEDIVEIHDATVRVFGGSFSAYTDALATEQEAARRSVRDAGADVRRQRRELVETQTKLDRRARTAGKAEREKRVPKIVAHGRRQQAEVSAGRLRGEHLAHVAAAQDRLQRAEEGVRDDREIRLELPTTRVPAGRDVLRTDGLVIPHVGRAVDVHLRGPERVALTGPNGSGKTTLLRVLLGSLPPTEGSVRLTVPAGYLSQRPDVPDDSLSVVENVRLRAPDASPQEVRAQLARLLFRGSAADQQVSTLSGGQRLRAALACLLLADPAPQLLVLDEPTNDLDLSSVQHLVQALRGYEGAVLVVSHDERFLTELACDRRIDLGAASA